MKRIATMIGSAAVAALLSSGLALGLDRTGDQPRSRIDELLDKWTFTLGLDQTNAPARPYRTNDQVQSLPPGFLSLEQAIEAARAKHPGHVLEAELDEERGRLVYELEIVTADGRVKELEVNAVSGQVVVRDSLLDLMD